MFSALRENLRRHPGTMLVVAAAWAATPLLVVAAAAYEMFYVSGGLRIQTAQDFRTLEDFRPWGFVLNGIANAGAAVVWICLLRCAVECFRAEPEDGTTPVSRALGSSRRLLAFAAPVIAFEAAFAWYRFQWPSRFDQPLPPEALYGARLVLPAAMVALLTAGSSVRHMSWVRWLGLVAGMGGAYYLFDAGQSLAREHYTPTLNDMNLGFVLKLQYFFALVTLPAMVVRGALLAWFLYPVALAAPDAPRWVTGARRTNRDAA